MRLVSRRTSSVDDVGQSTTKVSRARVCACLAVALILAPAGDGWAQSSPQSPPPQTQTQTAPAAQSQPGSKQPEPKQAETPPPKTRREGRKKKRTPRTSTRTPPPPAQGSFDEKRTSRVAGPTRQELTLTANVLGGYDDNLTAGLGTGSGIAPTAMASGSSESLDATLGYFRGNTLRSIRMESTGNLLEYPGYLQHPAAGGAATVNASTTVGRNQTIRASERVGYEPFFNIFSPGASSVPLPPGIGATVPATGLFERRSLSSNSSMSIDSRWSRRNWTSLSYSYRVQRFRDDDYGDSSAHEALTEYRRGLSPGLRAHAEYRYVDTRYTASDGAALPTRQHRIEGGPEIETALSRRRRLTLSLGAGAAYIESIGAKSREPYHAWVPVGSARATLGLSSLWSAEGGYRRDFSQLRGVTDDVYTTDTAFLTTGGLVAPRTDLRLGATYSNWRTPLASGADGMLRVYGGSLRLRVAVTAKVAATADYYYYHHRYSNPGELPAGFPAEFGRNAVRVGLTLWVPLAGASSPPRLAPR